MVYDMTMAEVRDVVLGITRVTEFDFHRSCRERRVLVAKWPFIKLARAWGFTFPEISEFIGYSDHTSALHGYGVMTDVLASEDFVTDPYSKRLRWAYYESVQECDRRLRELRDSAEKIDIEAWTSTMVYA